MRRAGIAVLAAVLLLAAAPVRIPQSEIDAENARWTALGAKLPAGGVVLPDPYAAPYSNRSFVVPWSWYKNFYDTYRATHAYPVRASALRADLPVLRLLMQKTYSGYQTAAQRGWNWPKWFADWDTSLARRGDAALTLEQAFAPWGTLEKFQLDNHSGVASLQTFISGSTSAILAKRPAGTCSALHMSSGSLVKLSPHDAGVQPHAVKQWDGSAFSAAWYVSYPKREGTAASIECGSVRIGLTHISQAEVVDRENPVALTGTPSYEPAGEGIAIVRMPTFTEANDDALRAALAKAPGLSKERVVVLDLRGNEGGNAPSDVLNNWVAESAIENAGELEQDGTQSCFNNALTFGLQQQLSAGLKPPVSAGVTRYAQSVLGLLAPPSNCNVVPQVHHSQSHLTDHRFSIRPEQGSQPRIIALVDALCGSDCEYMTAVVAGLPDSVIAGTSTYGVMGFTQPGYFVLPHTRVPFRLAQSRTDVYGDGRSVDGYGISVDVLLPTAASQSRASLIALAKQLAP